MSSTRRTRGVAQGGRTAADAARAFGLAPPRPKADPDDYQWRKMVTAEGRTWGKAHIALTSTDAALCCATNNEPGSVGNVDADSLTHEGRCKRCLHYINASGGAIPPDWPKTTEIQPLKKEYAMGSADRIVRLRAEAERMLDQAAELEKRPSEPDADEEGNAVVWFRVTSNDGDSRFYDYAAIRTTSGQWYTTGSAFGSNGVNWDRLVDYFFDNYFAVEIWHASEFLVIASK